MRDNWTSAPLRALAIKTLGGDWGKGELDAPANAVATTVIRGSEFRNWTTERAASAPTRWLRPDSLERRRLVEGDLVIEVSGGGPSQPVGRTLVIDAAALSSTAKPLVCTNFCRQIRLAAGVVPRFVALALKTHYASGAIEAIQTNTTNLRNLNFESFLDLEIPLPPVAEQQRIADAVEALAARNRRAKASLDAAPPLLDKLRQSILAAAFRGDLTADWRAKNPDVEPADKLLARIRAERRARWEATELAKLTAKGKPPTDDRWKSKYTSPTAPAPTGLFSLPDGWTWVPLPLLGELARGKSKHRPRNDPRLFGASAPFIQTGEVTRAQGRIRYHETMYSDFGVAQSRLFPKGTVCITIAASIAETGILDFDACFPDSVVGLIPDGGATAASYIEYFLRTARADLRRFAPATAQANINLEVLGEVVAPVPPLEEQRLLVTRLDEALDGVTRLAQLCADARASLHTLDQSVLARAFRGELSPQDPTDEPASTLIERIRVAVNDISAAPPQPSAELHQPPATDSLETATAVDQAFAALWPRGPLDKDAAIRRFADHLRDAGLVSFQRLRADGPLYAQLADAIDAAVKAGQLDRPKRGQVRACKPDATAYTADDWRHALLAVLGPSPTDRDDAIRAAAEWARDNCGLEFTRLRADGHIVTGLRSALNSAIRAKLITRIDATRIARAPAPPADRQLSLLNGDS